MSTKKIIFIMLALAATFFTSCSDEDSASGSEGLQKSIVILYDNDVHCAIDGYTKMAGLHDAIMQRDTAWTGIVSCGDFLQGGTPGAHQQSHTVSDVSVLDKETSTWLPIDTKRLYTIAVPDYYKGGAFFDLLKDCRLLSFLPTLTRDILAIFMEGSLGGIIPDIYAQPQGRIIIEDN